MKAKVNEVVTKVQAMLGDGYKVSAIDSFKNARSGKDVGFTIHKDGKAYAPVLYLPVSDIAEGNTDELAGRIVRDFKRVKDKSILLNSFDTITKDYILQNVVYRLIGQKNNKKLLKECPHKTFCDMALVYYVTVGEGEDNYLSFRVKNEHMDDLNFTLGELDEAALRNTTAEGISFFSIADMNRDMMLLRLAGVSNAEEEIFGGSRLPAKYDVPIEEAEICGARMYTLTNHRQLNGAAMVALPGVLKRIADQAGGDLIVYPGSIHEVHICKYMPQTSRAYCNQTVRKANRSLVRPDEILSNHAYRYRRDLGMLTIL